MTGRTSSSVHPHPGADCRHEHADSNSRADPGACRPGQAPEPTGSSHGRQGQPIQANRAWLRKRGIAATIPERDDQIAHRRKRRGRPIDFGEQQRIRYRGRNVVERCFNKLKQWRGIAMRSDKLARNYHAGLCLAAILHRLTSSSSNTA